MHRPHIPDVFEIPRDSEETGRFPWIAACAIAAIVIGATMMLVAAHEDVPSPGPQVTVGP
jgi:hypothetical protein